MNRETFKYIVLNLLIIAVALFLFVVAMVSEANAENIPYDWRKVDDGETPVVIYLEGSTWNIDKSIYTSSLYYGLNMICFCSKTDCYDFSGIWREADMKGVAEQIVSVIKEMFPNVQTVINISFSNGGYAADAVYEACKANGIVTVCAVSLESYPKRFGFSGIEADGVPLLIGLSDTVIKGNVTERSKQYAKSAMGGGRSPAVPSDPRTA